jgi:hypothetical protein
MGGVQVLIVNGPIRNALGINSGDAALGPGWRANSTIGRALRLAIRNVARSVPGEFDRAAYSHPGRYGWCFGEDEEGSGWPSLAGDRGLPPSQSAVTVYATTWQSTVVSDNRDPDTLVKQIGMGAREANYSGWRHMGEQPKTNFSEFYPGRGFLFVTGREHLRILQSGGMTKSEFRQSLFHYMTCDHPTLPPVAVAAPENVLVACLRATAMFQSWFFFPFHSSNPVTLPV